MTPVFRQVRPQDISDNPFHLIDSDWMLVTAGTIRKWNTMTASWGGLGILWNKPVAFSFVRPTRHTYEFIEQASRYTLSFFPERYRKAL
jgi:flavin reductase (DIM6/NTAB) family NADH-FMN oxidoreductase RutF